MEIFEIMNFSKQKRTLFEKLGAETIELLQATNAIVAGGALTSIFTGTDINDFDIYFRSKEDIIAFVRNAFCNEGAEDDVLPLSDEQFLDMDLYALVCQNCTTRSISFTRQSGEIIQLIYFDYFSSAEDIFKSYDFTINMGAYDFKLDSFVMNESFLIDIAARKLSFNPGTRYPIMSTVRVSKYKARGYSISMKEMFKIGIAISDLNIDSWDALEDQLSGFYGVDVSEMFDRRVEFSIEKALEMIDAVYEIPESKRTSPTLDMLFFNILGNKFADQHIFFKRVLLHSNGVISKQYSNNDEPLFVLNKSTYVTNLQIETSLDDVIKFRHYGYGAESKIAVLLLEPNGKMTMQPDGLNLSGNVKLISLRDCE